MKICLFDPLSGLCTGCGRTLEEIAAWARLDDAARGRITAELPERMKRLRPD